MYEKERQLKHTRALSLWDTYCPVVGHIVRELKHTCVRKKAIDETDILSYCMWSCSERKAHTCDISLCNTYAYCSVACGHIVRKLKVHTYTARSKAIDETREC